MVTRPVLLRPHGPHTDETPVHSTSGPLSPVLGRWMSASRRAPTPCACILQSPGRRGGRSLAAKEGPMAIDLLKDKGTALDKQRFTWKELVQPTYSKLDDDAFTRV